MTPCPQCGNCRLDPDTHRRCFACGWAYPEPRCEEHPVQGRDVFAEFSAAVARGEVKPAGAKR